MGNWFGVCGDGFAGNRLVIVDKLVDKLRVVCYITSEMVHDADDLPDYDGGNCRYYGAYPDNPIPNERLFVVFNREPSNNEEALETVTKRFS